MEFYDSIPLAGSKRTKDGYLSGVARVARTGVQQYFGYQVKKPELLTVAVYRPDEEVHATDSWQTFAGRPITIDHPPGGVSAENWKDLSVGHVGGVVKRDGDFIVVPFAIMDSDAIGTIESGKRELSMGYTCELVWGDGVAPDGTPYQATQRNIQINHLAIVDKARGGPELRIDGQESGQPEPGQQTGDQHKTGERMMADNVTITLDGLTATMTADAAEKVKKSLADAKATLADANKALETQKAALADAKAELAKKDGELEAAKTALEDAKKAASPEALDKLVADRVAVIDKARGVAPSITVDGKSNAAIQREAVVAAQGEDAVKRLEDTHGDSAHIAISALFDSLTPTDNGSGDNKKEAVSVSDAYKVYVAGKTAAYKMENA